MKIDDVKTIWDFKDFLVELSNKDPAMFAPLSFRYQLILQKHEKIIRSLFVFTWLAGFVFGLGVGGILW